ncbi:MAG TPA: asparagine synthase (glutamine-hydrolyzing) [Verrucomicrobiales bacterium]|nr:asparagine synthase (glutamine-hydrolyzing) [Verrucomicrobiales bacterium]
MCGIAGIIVQRPQPLRQWLEASAGAMSHRGPDDWGFLWSDGKTLSTGRSVEDSAASILGFAHRRLSILDLSERGRQPMVTSDGRTAICYNGEVYNYRELRGEAESGGAVFHTGTDTEVILHLLKQRGVESVPAFRGMFGFGFVDLDRQKVLLVRDFFGIKPLYYTVWEGGIAFASEMRALLALPQVDRSLDPQVLYNFLRFSVADDGRSTLYRGIRQVKPGHFLEIDLRNPSDHKEHCYWQLELKEPQRLSFSEAAEGLRERFVQSVRLHLRSDVPVGAALSGGVDSSAIVACMRKLEPEAEIHTFSYTPRGHSFSEEKWARLAAESAGARQHFVDFTAAELTQDLDRLLKTQEEPVGSTSIYAQARIFRRAREEGVIVMLDGQGGDEILAGYPMYFGAKLAGMVRRGEWGRLWNLWRNRSHAGGGHRSAWFMAAGHLLPGWIERAGRKLVRKELFPPWLNRQWFKDQKITPGRMERRLDRTGVRGVLVETLTRTILPQLLHFEDRNSMAYSVESRVPFLDVDFAEFALSLPEEYLLGDDGITKKVFKEAMRGLVPGGILDRRDKVGFHTPGSLSLIESRPWVEEIVNNIPDTAKQYVNPAGLKMQWGRTLAGKTGNDHGFWRALCFLRWMQLRNDPA